MCSPGFLFSPLIGGQERESPYHPISSNRTKATEESPRWRKEGRATETTRNSRERKYGMDLLSNPPNDNPHLSPLPPLPTPPMPTTLNFLLFFIQMREESKFNCQLSRLESVCLVLFVE